MPGIVRWASYAPAASVDGRRVAAPDEDEFTLAATAIERALSGDPLRTPVARIDLVGDLPAVADWGLGAVVGSTLEVVRHPTGAASFWAALDTALSVDAPRPSSLVVAAEIPERGGGAGPTARSRRGAAAIAALVDGTRTGDALSADKRVHEGSAIDAAYAVWRAQGSTEPSSWVGDWSADPDGGRPIALASVLEAASPPLAAVSEGAYVPRPRYVENLPSRWRLVAEECGACGALTFPARGACRRCGSRERLGSVALPRDGATVLASTVIGKGGQPTEFDAQVAATGGYGVVLAELAPGVRVTLQVTDSPTGSLEIGSRIATRLRRLYPMEGEWRYGRKAVPLDAGPILR